MTQDATDSPLGELLLIHEDTDVRRTLTASFQSVGYKVNAVVRSSNAEKFIKEGKIRGVLIALEGGADCFPGLRELKSRLADVPFVVMMKEPSREDQRACFLLGVAEALLMFCAGRRRTTPPVLHSCLTRSGAGVRGC